MKRIWLLLVVCAAIPVSFFLSCMTPSNRMIALPDEIPGAEPVGMETCDFCHSEMVQTFKYTTHSRSFVDMEEREIVGCEACHGNGSLHLEAGGGRGQFIINPEKDPSACYSCHLQVKAAFNFQYHHPVREEHLSCTSCHDPHGKVILEIDDMASGGRNAVCGQCHREQTRPRVFEHEALRDGCSTCHNPHGAINDKLLAESGTFLCLKCHAQVSMPDAVPIGDFDHTNQLAQGTCWSAGCHTAVHGSDINPHLRY